MKSTVNGKVALKLIDMINLTKHASKFNTLPVHFIRHLAPPR